MRTSSPHSQHRTTLTQAPTQPMATGSTQIASRFHALMAKSFFNDVGSYRPGAAVRPERGLGVGWPRTPFWIIGPAADPLAPREPPVWK